MPFFQRLGRELVDIVEWLSDGQEALVWRFPRYRNEIKHGVQLIVRPGQVAVLVHQGRLDDVFDPGTYRLQTWNLPLLGTLLGWRHGFESPVKSEVYFISTCQMVGLTWASPQPVLLEDPILGPIRVRGFGSYSLQVVDAVTVFNQLVGTRSRLSCDDLHAFVQSQVAERFAEVVADSGLPIFELSAHYAQFSGHVRSLVAEWLRNQYGLDLPHLTIVGISLPAQLEEALEAYASMEAFADLEHYERYQSVKALWAAAQVPAGTPAQVGWQTAAAVATPTWPLLPGPELLTIDAQSMPALNDQPALEDEFWLGLDDDCVLVLEEVVYDPVPQAAFQRRRPEGLLQGCWDFLFGL